MQPGPTRRREATPPVLCGGPGLGLELGAGRRSGAVAGSGRVCQCLLRAAALRPWRRQGGQDLGLTRRRAGRGRCGTAHARSTLNSSKLWRAPGHRWMRPSSAQDVACVWRRGERHPIPILIMARLVKLAQNTDYHRASAAPAKRCVQRPPSMPRPLFKACLAAWSGVAEQGGGPRESTPQPRSHRHGACWAAASGRDGGSAWVGACTRQAVGESIHSPGRPTMFCRIG